MRCDLSIVLAVLTALAASTACGRANPRLRSVNGAVVTYDGRGHPVRADFEGGSTATMTFEGSRLASVFIDGARASRTAFDYDGDRVVEVLFDQTIRVPITYDGSTVTAIGPRTFTYEGGALTRLGTGETVTDEFKWDFGLLVSATEIRTEGVIDWTFSYDGGRLDRIDAASGETTSFTHFYRYNDEGLIDTRTTVFPGSEIEQVFEYEDGDVADVDITPEIFPPFSPLFDLRGHPHPMLDARTQIAGLFLPW